MILMLHSRLCRQFARFVGGVWAVLLLLMLPMPITVHAATIPVDTTDPGIVADAACGLAEAILAANTNTAANGCPAGDDAPVDTITLGAGVTYTLPVSYAVYLEPVGLPAITSTIVISGNGSTIAREQSGDPFGLLYVAPVSGTLTLIDLTLRNGDAMTNGGAIANAGVLTLYNSTVVSNSAIYGGGIATLGGMTTLSNTQVLSNVAGSGAGLYNLMGTLVITDSRIATNNGGRIYDGIGLNFQYGLGIFNQSGIASLTGTTVAENRTLDWDDMPVEGYGGGMYNIDSQVTLSATHFISNSVAGYFHGEGGGIYNSATLITVTDSLVQDNEAYAISPNEIQQGKGGGFFGTNNSHITLHNTNILHNQTHNGGGIFVEQSTLALLNTEVASNRVIFEGNSNSVSGSGGGIYGGESEMTLTGSRVNSNWAQDIGGGIYNFEGTLTLVDSEIFTNMARGGGSGIASGGGIMNSNNGVASLTNTRVGFNTSGLGGGGIFNAGVMTITASEIISNVGGLEDLEGGIGGGIGNSGVLSVTHSLLLSNTLTGERQWGGAIYAGDAPTYIAQSCIVGNEDVAVRSILSSIALDARNNWWGASNGPSGAGPGSGDSVDNLFGDGVLPLFEPFLTEPPLPGCPAPVLWGLGVSKHASKDTAVVGEEIHYTYHITNSSDTTMTIAAVDDKLGAISALAGALSPGAAQRATLPYTVQESDLPGPLVNSVTVTGTGTGGSIITRTQTVTLNVVADNGTPDFAVSVVADRDFVPLDGAIVYTYRITNSDLITVNISSARDDLTGELLQLVGPFAPGETRTVTRTHQAQMAELPGPVVNTVTVTGTDILNNTAARSASARVLISAGNGEPAFVVLISADQSVASVGETVVYSYSVVNTGDTAMIVSSAQDNRVGSISDLVGTVAPGATRSATASYVVQASDLPGPLHNELVVTANVSGSSNSNVGSASVSVLVEGDFTTILPRIQRNPVTQ